MKKILEDFYNGHISPVDKGCLNNPQLLRFMNIIADNEEILLDILEGESKELFVALSEAYTEMDSMIALEKYTDGFRMGMRLAVEALSKE